MLMTVSHLIDSDLLVLGYSLATICFKRASGDSNVQPKLRTTEIEEVLAYSNIKNLSKSGTVL